MEVTPLWFYLPYQNGKKPSKDVPWVKFCESERRTLEHGFVSLVRMMAKGLNNDNDNSPLNDDDNDDDESNFEIGNVKTSTTERRPAALPTRSTNTSSTYQSIKYPTIAQWYEPDVSTDIFVDQKRHAVSLLPCCHVCRSPMEQYCPTSLVLKFDQRCRSMCERCLRSPSSSSRNPSSHHVENFYLSPPVTLIKRPTMWRFHGPGDEVRRGVWLLDTKRHGLQPYSEESAAVLEDAYLFLKWSFFQNTRGDESGIDSVLLTVQVASPDGEEQQLVQFRSLSQVTAIQKTLGGAFSVFKSRVYRGANVRVEQSTDCADDGVVGENCEKNAAEGLDESQQDMEQRENDTLAVVPYEEDIKSIHDDTDSNMSLAAPMYNSTESGAATEEINTDNDIEHLILVVHGIGEMLRSTDLFGMALGPTQSIVECCSWLRKNHEEVLNVQVSNANRNKSTSQTRLDMGYNDCKEGRVEYIPIEWHEAFGLQSRRGPSTDVVSESSSTFKGTNYRERNSSLPTVRDISLRAIPHLRAFANDTALDILYFMSPDYHDIIIDIVTEEMNFIVERFRRLTGFQGHVSLMAHSLGSIITWDILAHQIASAKHPSSTGYIPTHEYRSSSFPLSSVHSDNNLPSKGESLHQENDTTQALPEKEKSEEYPQLSFQVMNTFMLGSPVAVFLMIRNQHKPLDESYSLPGCSRIFNIFHPYDPAAYRIEPLIDPKNADAEAKIITHWKGGFRVQYQTKILWKKIVENTWKTQKNLIAAVEKGMTEMGILDTRMDDFMEEEEDDYVISESDDVKIQPVNCGKLNQGNRIDYMLQEKEIEISNEYVFALAAHSTYWGEKDLSSFVARELSRSGNESNVNMTVRSLPAEEIVENQVTPPLSSLGNYFEYN